jgi:hypothetical protein
MENATYQNDPITPCRIGEDPQIVREFCLSGRLARVIWLRVVILLRWYVRSIIFGDNGRVGLDRCFLHVAKHSSFTYQNRLQGVRRRREDRLKESRREQSRFHVHLNIRLMKLKLVSITGWPQDLEGSCGLTLANKHELKRITFGQFEFRRQTYFNSKRTENQDETRMSQMVR